MASESKTDANAATETKVNPVRVILGTMTFDTTDITAAQLEGFVAGHTGETRPRFELDTARMYGHGNVEKLLGSVFEAKPELRAKYIVATKANPFKGFNDNLRHENVLKQAKECLEALVADSVDILYLHAPDIETPIEVTLAACQELYEEGKFRELGLSNYAGWEVAHIWHTCHRNGWVKPTVYQGMYNAITRQVEIELFASLRTFGIRFYAYNPLAGGLLTGRYKLGDDPSDGRFGGKTGPMYRARYFKEQLFEAIEVLRKVCAEAEIPMAEASLRWLMHHSVLKGGLNDGVIIGASSMSHLTSNVKSCNQGPLPAAIVEAFDHAEEVARPACPKYFRP